ncbi:hypothetical protein [Lacinutrix undariae]
MSSLYIKKVTEEVLNASVSILGIDYFTLGIIAVLELLIIVVLLFFIFKISVRNNKDLEFSDIDKKKLKKESINSGVNMGDLMDNINLSKSLYKQLSKTCHPDRFIGTDKNENAQEIFQEISNHKRDYKKLQELKLRAENELNLKFK